MPRQRVPLYEVLLAKLRTSHHNPLDFVLREPLLGPIIKLGGAWALMGCHGLGVLKRIPVARNEWLPIGAMMPADHAPGVDPVHGVAGGFTGATARRAEERAFVVTGDPSHPDVFVEEGFELVVCRHFVALAAFFVEADPPALSVGDVILDPHGDDGADTGERIGHDPDQGAVAQANEGRDVYALDQARALGQSCAQGSCRA
jgi:hypothetical protein